MANLTTHGGFDPEVLEKALAELNDENFAFSEGTERSARSGAGYPSLGGFIEQHFDFGEEPVSNFYTSDLRRLRDALKIAENNVAKGYSYGSHERVAELRAQMRDLLGQHMRNLAAAQEAAGDPVGTPDNCCTGEPGHGPTGVKVHTDNRGALIPEYAEEPEWSKEVYDSMQKAAAINEEIQGLYKDYEHEVRMMRYDKASTMFTRIRTLSEDFRSAYPVSDFQWDKDLRALEIKMHDAPSMEARLPLQNAYMKLQNRYYKDFKGMPMPDMDAQGYVPSYSEEGEDSAPFDFARCQRPDGSFYGTGGQCRKGSPTGAKEKEAPKGGRTATKTFKRSADGYEAAGAPGSSEAKRAAEKAKAEMDKARATHKELKAIADTYGNKSAPGARETRQDATGARRDLRAAESRYKKAVAHAQGGNTKATSATPKGSMNKADRARAEKASAARKVAAEMKPKVKELDRRAKDLNKEADRLERSFRRQAKVVQKSPTKENKARLKLLQRETRMADRAAKQADKAADKASAQMEKALRRALR